MLGFIRHTNEDVVEFPFSYNASAPASEATTSSTAPVSSPSPSATMAGDNNGNTGGPLSGITDPLQNLFGGVNQTTGGRASGAEMNMTNTTGGTKGGGVLEGIFGGVS